MEPFQLALVFQLVTGSCLVVFGATVRRDEPAARWFRLSMVFGGLMIMVAACAGLFGAIPLQLLAVAGVIIAMFGMFRFRPEEG